MRIFSMFARTSGQRAPAAIHDAVHYKSVSILTLLALSTALCSSLAYAAPQSGLAGSENAMQSVIDAAERKQTPQSTPQAEISTPEAEKTAPSQNAQKEESQPSFVSTEFRAAFSAFLASPEAANLMPQIADMYAANNFTPVWLAENTFSTQAQAAIARIKQADDDGLDARAYTLPALAENADDLTRIKAEIALSQAVALYAIHAQSGRIAPSSISKLITAVPEKPSAPVAIMRVAQANDAMVTLENFNPPHAEFQALRALLKHEREKAAPAAKPRIAYGAVLRLGQTDPRIPDLRVHLNVPAPTDITQQNVYDAPLLDAVKTFQQANNLRSAGILGRQTVDALNANVPQDNTSALLVNMERWRWVPRDFGAFHIVVNVPEYMGRVVRNGEIVHEMRVIVGSVKNQTPLFSHVMDHIVVNPYWHIPRSIATKEMLPKLRSDPNYLSRQGIEVVRVANGRQQVVNPTMIDWANTNGTGLHFRQPPGERNALGRIKFMFPNEHAVYLHDTPSRNLFNQNQRALSHGCVRVHDPFALAEALQGPSKGQQLRKMVGGRERRIDLSHQPNVHLVYFTRWVNEGTLVSRPDIYGHDRRLEAALRVASEKL